MLGLFVPVMLPAEMAHAIGEVADVTWRETHAAHAPAPRRSFAMATYPDARQVVLFGGWLGSGWDSQGPQNDTWVWNGSDWTERSPAHVPSAGETVGLAYDSQRRTMVLFVGGTYESRITETWEWNGADWTNRSPVHSPPARFGFAMAQNPDGGVLLHAGTEYAAPGPRNDTWLWTGADWELQSPAVAPDPTYAARMTYDAGNDEIVLIQNEAYPSSATQTWVWRGGSWARRTPAHAPPERTSAALGYVRSLGVVFYGGNDDSNCPHDTWIWTGTDWVEQFPAGVPTACGYAEIAEDPARGMALLFGGYGDNGLLDETWHFNASPRRDALGGQLVGGPAASSWGSGRIDVAVRGTDNALWHKWYDGGWHNWESLGGVLTNAPSAASWSPGRYDVFARGTDGALWHRWYDGRWHDWESLGGYLLGAPAAVSLSPNRLDVFVRGLKNVMYHRWWDGSRWHPWESLGGLLHSDPAASAAGPWDLDVFVKGSDGRIWNKSYDDSHRWHEWSAIEPASYGYEGLAAAYYTADRLDLFAVDRGVVWQTTSADDYWVDVMEPATSVPAAVSWAPGRMDLFVRGAHGELSHAWAG